VVGLAVPLGYSRGLVEESSIIFVGFGEAMQAPLVRDLVAAVFQNDSLFSDLVLDAGFAELGGFLGDTGEAEVFGDLFGPRKELRSTR
jgi:hypothetical protein